MEIKNNEAVNKLRRLLNTNFKENNFVIKITYETCIQANNA